MTLSQTQFAQRSTNLDNRAEAALNRCLKLTGEAETLLAHSRNKTDRNNAHFVLELISDASDKAVECKLKAGSLDNRADNADSQLAVCDRWLKLANDSLNQAQLVLDEVVDIWGNKLPTGGLWDK